MRKLKDKTIIIICSICMTIICCFGISYKSAHKTYASDLTPITDKQRLGAFLCSLAFSAGVKFYITTAQTWEWLADNFNYVMLRLQLTQTANDVYQNARDNFDNNTKTYKLDPEFSKAVQEYLKYLQSQGINQNSGQVELGSYETNIPNYYSGDFEYLRGYSGWSDYYMYTDDGVRVVFTPKNTNNIYVCLCADKPNKKYSSSASETRPSTLSSTLTSNTTINGVTYYYTAFATTISHGTFLMEYCTNKTSYPTAQEIVSYTYGINSSTQETHIVMGEPNRYWFETEMTLDRPSEYEVDYSDTDGAEDTSTLEELIELVNNLIDTGTQTQQETIPQVDVQVITPTIDPTTIDIPTLFDGIPQIITPDCVGLGACLVSGVQSVSQHLQDIYNSNSSVANYTLVSLAVGVALYILTGGI